MSHIGRCAELGYLSVTDTNFPHIFPIMLNFLCLFVLFQCSENRLKINIAPYEEIFFYLTYKDKI